MRRTADQARNEITEVVFPLDSYPVLYKTYWSEYLDQTCKLELNTTGIYPGILIDVFRTYYNVELDLSTLTSFTYDNDRSPYQLIFIIRYKGADGKELYLWEYYNNFMKIVELNNPKNA